MSRSVRSVPAVAAIAACVLWATGGVVSKDLLNAINPLWLLATQLAVSLAVLWCLALLLGERPHLRDWPLALPGLLQPGLSTVLVFAGLRHVPVSVEATLFALETPCTLLFASILLRDQLAPRVLQFSLIAAAGAALLSFASSRGGAELKAVDLPVLFGVLLILAGVLFASLSAIVYRSMAARGSALRVVTLSQTASLFLVAPLLATPLASPIPRGLETHQIIQIIVSGLAQQAIPFLLFSLALARSSASFASLFLPLIPLLTVGLASAFLGEALNEAQWGGLMLVLSGGTAALVQQSRGDRVVAHP